MDLFTVSFFGHRTVPEFWKAEERVESLIHTLLLEKEYVEFLVGRNGDFDRLFLLPSSANSAVCGMTIAP